MNFVLLIIATVMLAIWISLAVRVTESDIQAVNQAKLRAQQSELREIQNKGKKKLAALAEVGVEENSREMIKTKKKFAKKFSEVSAKVKKFSEGKMEFYDYFPTVGYVIMRKLRFDSNNKFFRWLIQCYIRIDGKEFAMLRAAYLLSSGVSYIYISVMMGVGLASLLLSTGNSDGLTLGLIIMMLGVVFAYIPLNELSGRIRYRDERITAEFPNAVSKLALLVNSGMEVSKAWELTAYSNDGVLYEEMQNVVEMQNNNVSPTTAYTKFMDNCNNKYTTKLATSILQNLSKGNSEIGAMFLQLNEESWSEKKHNAKRVGEKAQGNLLVPTLIIFAGILIIIIVPMVIQMVGSV